MMLGVPFVSHSKIVSSSRFLTLSDFCLLQILNNFAYNFYKEHSCHRKLKTVAVRRVGGSKFFMGGR